MYRTSVLGSCNSELHTGSNYFEIWLWHRHIFQDNSTKRMANGNAPLQLVTEHVNLMRLTFIQNTAHLFGVHQRANLFVQWTNAYLRMNTNLFTQNPTTPQTHTHRQSTTHRNNRINWINTNNFRRFRERNRKVPPGDYKLEMSYEIVKCISNTRLKMITPFWMRHLMAHCILKTITTLTNA